MAKDKMNKNKINAIYKIYFSTKLNLFYIGSSVDFAERKRRHKYHLNKNIHKNKYLQNIYNKYGAENMIFEIIEIVNSKFDLIKREQFYIDNLNPKLNLLRIAGSALGYRHSEKAKKIISIKNKGRVMTENQIAKGVKSRIGPNTSKGCIRTESVKKHLSDMKKKKVVYNGKVYDCLQELSIEIGYKYNTLYAMLSGRNSNKLNIKIQ